MNQNDADPFGIVRAGVLSTCLFFVLLIVLTLLRGGTIVDVVAMPGWVIKVANSAFTLSVLAFLMAVAWANTWGRGSDLETGEVRGSELRGAHPGGNGKAFYVVWENHQTPVYASEGIDADVAMLMSGGASRKEIVDMGLSGTQYNKFSSWLRKKGVGGSYKITRA